MKIWDVLDLLTCQPDDLQHCLTCNLFKTDRCKKKRKSCSLNTAILGMHKGEVGNADSLYRSN